MIIRDHKEFDKFLKRLSRQIEVVTDCETDGLEVWQHNRLCGLGFRFKDKSTYYLPFRHKRFNEKMALFAALEENLEPLNLPLKWMQNIWPQLQKVKTLIGHNIKFDLAAMSHDGYTVPDDQMIEDTRSGARLYFKEKHADLSLENIVSELISKDAAIWKAKFASYLQQRGIEDHYDLAEVDVLGEYCERDCDYTFQARDKLYKHADATGQTDVYETEQDTVRVLWHMERAGLKLDMPYITHAIEECKRACDTLMAEIVKISGKQINPWSEPEVTEVLKGVGQKVLKMTQGTAKSLPKPSWKNEVLEKVKHPLGKLILDWRKIDKMANTFFIPYSMNESGYVHPSYNPAGTITGRLSCNSPNLQQASRVEEWDIECLPGFDIQVRRMLVAPEGYKFLFSDYSQMEMIGFADYLGDSQLTANLNKGMIDYHMMASELIKIATGIDLPRQDSKAVSLGLIYGMGKEKLAKRLDKSEDEAQVIKNAFFKAFPTARPFIEKVHSLAKERGYVFNRFGRRYYIDEEHVYAGVNYLVQGTCADIIKRAMVRLFNEFKAQGFKSRLAFQLHDEFGFYVWEPEWNMVVERVIAIMEDTMLKTKLFVDLAVGCDSWADKKKVCKICYRIKENDHKC